MFLPVQDLEALGLSLSASFRLRDGVRASEFDLARQAKEPPGMRVCFFKNCWLLVCCFVPLNIEEMENLCKQAKSY